MLDEIREALYALNRALIIGAESTEVANRIKVARDDVWNIIQILDPDAKD